MISEGVYDKAVVAASRNGHVALIEALVAAGADVNEGREKRPKRWWGDDSYSSSEGNTALILAAQNRQKACIETLIRLGADVNETGEDDRTALAEAIEAFDDDIDIVLKKIQAGADVNFDAYAGSALECASRKGYINTVRLLLQSGACVNDGIALMKASSGGHIDVVKLLMDSGANVNCEPDLGRHGTALAAASSNGHVDIVKLLLAAGADVNLAAKCYNSALMNAVSDGNLEIARLLIQVGVNVNYISGHHSFNESTALFLASSSGHVANTKCLIEAGANVNLTIKDGETALMEASYKGSLDMVTLLVQAGADVNHTCRYNRNALFMASSRGRAEIVKYLIASGSKLNCLADSTLRYRNKTTALVEALYNRDLETTKVLINSGADVNQVLKDGWSALMIAVSQGHIDCIEFLRDMQKAGYLVSYSSVGSPDKRHELSTREKRWRKRNNVGEPYCGNSEKLSKECHFNYVKLLVESRADVNIATNNGLTAPMIASLDGYLDILQLLVESGANVNATCKMGWSSLIYAIVGNHYKCAKALLHAGANVNVQADSPNQSTLEFALNKGTEDMVKLVILSGHHPQYLRKTKELSRVKNGKIIALLEAGGYIYQKKFCASTR